MRVLGAWIFSLALLGCRQQTTEYDKPYLDVDSLVNRQVNRLVARKAHLRKTAVVGGLRDEQRWQPDSTQWANELDVFRQLDAINRPGIISSFDKKFLSDPLSNLQIEQVAAKHPAPVAWFRIYRQTPDKIRKIEAHYLERNALFTSGRTLTWELNLTGNQPELAHYLIQGFQKMVASDSVLYRIEGTIDE